MNELALPSAMWEQLSSIALATANERCAVLLARDVRSPSGAMRLLAHELITPEDQHYLRCGPLEARLAPAFVADVTRRARRAQSSIIFVHSHPGTESPYFSIVDDDGEERLAAFLAHRHPEHPHAAMVVSRGGVRCRHLGGSEEIRVLSTGSSRRLLSERPGGSHAEGDFDRQIRAFGTMGQLLLEKLVIGIVGLGGTGSIVAQEMAHLGVRRFVLIDPDIIERSNLNRVVFARPADVGSAKVELAKLSINWVQPNAQVNAIQGNVVWASCGRALLDCDLIFGCTDSHGSRAVLEQIAYQYLIATIDMGSVIRVEDGNITHIVGRVQMLAPGLACLTCGRLLDPEQVRRDMMTEFERRQDPYIVGTTEPAPAVISINGTVTSLAVTMALAAVSGIPIPSRHLLYLGLSSALRSIDNAPQPECVVCSSSGRLARGDSWPFPGRQD
jgi:molybdopterin-synthase adenylyltransferase